MSFAYKRAKMITEWNINIWGCQILDPSRFIIHIMLDIARFSNISWSAVLPYLQRFSSYSANTSFFGIVWFEIGTSQYIKASPRSVKQSCGKRRYKIMRGIRGLRHGRLVAAQAFDKNQEFRWLRGRVPSRQLLQSMRSCRCSVCIHRSMPLNRLSHRTGRRAIDTIRNFDSLWRRSAMTHVTQWNWTNCRRSASVTVTFRTYDALHRLSQPVARLSTSHVRRPRSIDRSILAACIMCRWSSVFFVASINIQLTP
jgi:hypothetical protein